MDPERAQLLAVPDHGLLLLYDGVCGLCNGLVRFLIKRDRGDRYRFATLQSELGRQLVRGHGYDPDVISTVYVLSRPGLPAEKVWRRGRAAVIAIAGVGRGWSLFHGLRILPSFLLDFGYGLVARRRYRLFGKLDSCPAPEPGQRHKFLAH